MAVAEFESSTQCLLLVDGIFIVMKVTKKALVDLLELAGDQCQPSLTPKHLQAVLDIQGYFAGISRVFFPRTDEDGNYCGWEAELRF
jgi:hypothetical protein